MANDFINNDNLNNSNSLTHLVNDHSILEENEPTILNNSNYYDHDSFLNSKQIINSNFLMLSLDCQNFNSTKLNLIFF